MSGRARRGRLLRAFVVCAVLGGLVSWAVASGGLRWDASWIESRPPPRVGAWRPLPTAPPSTYPVVPAQPGAPPARHLQPVYAVPSDAEPVPGRGPAILHEIGEVTAFFRAELDGAYPRYAPDGQAPKVITVALPWSADEVPTDEQWPNDLPTWLHDQGWIEPHAIPLIYVEANTDEEACGWARVAYDELERFADPVLDPSIDSPLVADLVADLRATLAKARADIQQHDHIMIFLRRCPEDQPTPRSHWPGGGTRLLAHETTHALGAVDPDAPHYVYNGHTDDDPRDIVHTARGWVPTDRYVIDPGRDDYYRHGRPGVRDIANSFLLVRPSSPVG
jgi:hypothetical protein